MSSRVGTRNGMPASRMRRLARTSRCAMAAGSTANAWAMRAASKPSTTCSMSGVRAAGSIAGWAHANSSSSRRTGIASRAGSSSAPQRSSGRSVDVRAAAEVTRSRSRLRATVISQPSGLWGTPAAGQVRSARSNASASASSARARSRVEDASRASRRPYGVRTACSAAAKPSAEGGIAPVGRPARRRRRTAWRSGGSRRDPRRRTAPGRPRRSPRRGRAPR